MNSTNRPFNSTNMNIYDEFVNSASPTILNGQNVLITQDQQRRICDITNTTIADNNQSFFNVVGNDGGVNLSGAHQFNQRPSNPINNNGWIQANKQLYPGGVVKFQFVKPRSLVPEFVSVHQNNFASAPLTAFNYLANDRFPISINSQTPTPSVVTTTHRLLPENAPLGLKLHYNVATSCSDLLSHSNQFPPSKASADFQNAISGSNHQNRKLSNQLKLFSGLFPLPSTQFSSNARKLHLSKKKPSANLLNQHIVDIFNDNNDTGRDKKAHVSFSDQRDAGATAEKLLQTSFECICDNRKCKKIKKKKKQKGHLSTSCCTTDDDDDDNDCEYKENHKKMKIKKTKKVDSVTDDDTTDSESENQ